MVDYYWVCGVVVCFLEFSDERLSVDREFLNMFQRMGDYFLGVYEREIMFYFVQYFRMEVDKWFEVCVKEVFIKYYCWLVRGCRDVEILWMFKIVVKSVDMKNFWYGLEVDGKIILSF